ncbi:hypothetical protein CTI12_AA038040 [Artemisia annua]|uniref:Uncharacterized protein n=1 Tax=Artemisia annua TaxID=35608 RepID=A0A2U1QFM7_ARTAN|nr:hypothetical protein CTI12_AA038040 [Artemisia annua]
MRSFSSRKDFQSKEETMNFVEIERNKSRDRAFNINLFSQKAEFRRRYHQENDYEEEVPVTLYSST